MTRYFKLHNNNRIFLTTPEASALALANGAVEISDVEFNEWNKHHTLDRYGNIVLRPKPSALPLGGTLRKRLDHDNK